MKSLTDLTKELGELLEDKDKKYGSSTTVSGTMLRLLYPEGVPVNQYQNVTLLVRIFDKMKRIATGASDENSWQDIAGYGVQGWKQTVNQAETEEVLFKLKQYENKASWLETTHASEQQPFYTEERKTSYEEQMEMWEQERLNRPA